MKKLRKDKFTPYLFILPHVIVFLLFFLYPMVNGIYASFTKWNLFSDPVWVGLENYKTIFFNQDSTFYRQFWVGLRNTVTFVLLCVPPQIILPLVLAALLYLRPRGHRLFQSIFYMPTLFSITSVILTWLFIFNRSLGLFNKMLGTDVNWYGEQPWAWTAIVIVTLWWVIGSNLIIYVAAFSGVDRSLLESAQIDGAGGLRRFFSIMLPSIRFPLVYTIVMAVISQFNIYGQPLLLHNASEPIESVTVLLIYIRKLAFGTGNPIAGMSSAMATCLGLIIGVVSIGQTIILRKQDD